MTCPIAGFMDGLLYMYPRKTLPRRWLQRFDPVGLLNDKSRQVQWPVFRIYNILSEGAIGLILEHR